MYIDITWHVSRTLFGVDLHKRVRRNLIATSYRSSRSTVDTAFRFYTRHLLIHNGMKYILFESTAVHLSRDAMLLTGTSR